MKKFIFGCLGLVLVLGVGGAVAGYYFIYRPTKAYIMEFAKLHEIPQLNQQVRKTSAFNPPADNVLSSETVDRFLRAQQAIQAKLGTRLDALSAKYRTLDQAHGTDYKPSFGDMMSALRDLSSLVVEAKRAQIEALNETNFSLAEYDWTRQRVYEAAGIPIDARFAEALRAIANGKSPKDVEKSLTVESSVVVPEQNRTLVAPHVKELGERAALAFFGL